eukprot:UN10896
MLLTTYSSSQKASKLSSNSKSNINMSV